MISLVIVPDILRFLVLPGTVGGPSLPEFQIGASDCECHAESQGFHGREPGHYRAMLPYWNSFNKGDSCIMVHHAPCETDKFQPGFGELVSELSSLRFTTPLPLTKLPGQYFGTQRQTQSFSIRWNDSVLCARYNKQTTRFLTLDTASRR
jgi:hypothetical protein